MEITVTKQFEGFVRPSEATPSGKLFLSWQDNLPSGNALIDFVYVYMNGNKDSGKVVREALSKVLVPYYPVAGILVRSEESRQLEVDCTGQGVWFVEATVACTLEDVNYLTYPLKIPKEQLLPQPPAATEDGLLLDPMCLMKLIQVTTFACGGFAIAVRTNHVISDGIGMSQFLKALAEIARGCEKPSVSPVWCRDVLPVPTKLPQGLPLESTDVVKNLKFAVIDVPLAGIDRLKLQFSEELGKSCTTFEVLVAIAWQSRTRAIDIAPSEDVHLCFPIDIRNLFQDLIPKEAFYGNCIHMLTVTSPSWNIAEGELIDVVKLIRAAKEDVSTDFYRWINGDPTTVDPCTLGNSYEAFFITDLRWMASKEHDMGWGAPLCFHHVYDGANHSPIVKSPVKRCVRMITRAVKQEHLEFFVEQVLRAAGN